MPITGRRLTALGDASTKRGHKLVRSEPAPMPLACRDEQSSKLDSVGRGVRSLRGYRQGTSQPRYAFGRGHSLAQDGKGRARPRRTHKPRPDFLASAYQSDYVLSFAPAACSVNHRCIWENDLNVLRRSGRSMAYASRYSTPAIPSYSMTSNSGPFKPSKAWASSSESTTVR
jgi:hypothetical protein